MDINLVPKKKVITVVIDIFKQGIFYFSPVYLILINFRINVKKIYLEKYIHAFSRFILHWILSFAFSFIQILKKKKKFLLTKIHGNIYIYKMLFNFPIFNLVRFFWRHFLSFLQKKRVISLCVSSKSFTSVLNMFRQIHSYLWRNVANLGFAYFFAFLSATSLTQRPTFFYFKKVRLFKEISSFWRSRLCLSLRFAFKFSVNCVTIVAKKLILLSFYDRRSICTFYN